MIHNKTRVWITWFAAIAIVAIVFNAINKGMNDVASAGVGILGLIVSAYTAGKTLNNIKKP